MCFIHIEGDTTYIVTGGLWFLPLPEPLASLEAWCCSQPGMNRGTARATTLAIGSRLASGKGRIKASPICVFDESPDWPENWKYPIRLFVAIFEGSPAQRVFDRATQSLKPSGPVCNARKGEILWVPETEPTGPVGQETELPPDVAKWCDALDRLERCGPVKMDDDAWGLARHEFMGWPDRAMMYGEEIDPSVYLEQLTNVAGTLAMLSHPEQPRIDANLMSVAVLTVDHDVRYRRAMVRELERLEREMSKVVPIQPQTTTIRPPWEQP